LHFKNNIILHCLVKLVHCGSSFSANFCTSTNVKYVTINTFKTCFKIQHWTEWGTQRSKLVSSYDSLYFKLCRTYIV